MELLLPCSSSLLCEDRFGLVDSDAPKVPLWDILNAVLQPALTSWADLVERLDTIAVTVRGVALEDYKFLSAFLENEWAARKDYFFEHVWPSLVHLALDMPHLFPTHSLVPLSSKNRSVALSRRQVACLVIHQFLCSLAELPWHTDSSPDFSLWYSSNVRHPNAVRAYLYALFVYFERVVSEQDDFDISTTSTMPGPNVGKMPEWPIVFTLRKLDEENVFNPALSAMESRFVPLEVKHLPMATTEPAFLGLPDGACVVSANKNIGFGSTGTQEEAQVGSTPESCPVVLLARPLREREVVIVQGAEAVISVQGYGRQACLGKVLSRDHSAVSDSQISVWRLRTMLFMDALELDLANTDGIIPDLLPGNVSREFIKAYTAFGSSEGSSPYREIVTGLWGCGAFGGNREIKAIIQWCAASMAGTPLSFVCCGEDQGEFAVSLQAFVDKCLERSWRVRDVLDLLLSLRPDDAGAKSAFLFVLEHC